VKDGGVQEAEEMDSREGEPYLIAD